MARGAGAAGRSRQRPLELVPGLRGGEELVYAVQLRDRDQAPGQIVQPQRAAAPCRFAHPRQEHREQRRVELGDAGQVDCVRTSANRRVALLQRLSDVGKSDRARYEHALALALNHRFFFPVAGASGSAAAAAATGLAPEFFACNALIRPSIPESRTMLANS